MKLSQLFLFIFFIFLIFTKIVFSSWPVFMMPDKKLLSDLGKIDTTACPEGQGKLLSNSSINIKQYLCLSFCPQSWSWHGITDNTCHNLDTEFEFQGYEISYVRDNNNVVNFTKIIARYGRKNHNDSFMQFKFTSEPRQYWQCIETGINAIVCANDVLRRDALLVSRGFYWRA